MKNKAVAIMAALVITTGCVEKDSHKPYNDKKNIHHRPQHDIELEANNEHGDKTTDRS